MGDYQRHAGLQPVSFSCSPWQVHQLKKRGHSRTLLPLAGLDAFDCQFPTPHFNAYIDLDGDCLADLFLTCQNGQSPDDLSYQIWLNNKAGGYKLGLKGNLPLGTKSVGFADMGTFLSRCVRLLAKSSPPSLPQTVTVPWTWSLLFVPPVPAVACRLPTIYRSRCAPPRPSGHPPPAVTQKPCARRIPSSSLISWRALTTR